MLSGETWKYEAGGEESGRQKLRVDWESPGSRKLSGCISPCLVLKNSNFSLVPSLIECPDFSFQEFLIRSSLQIMVLGL